jgi:hypothetical protein
MELFYDERDDAAHEARGSRILHWLDDLGTKPLREAKVEDDGFLFRNGRCSPRLWEDSFEHGAAGERQAAAMRQTLRDRFRRRGPGKRQYPRQELNLPLDLRRVVCLRHTPRIRGLPPEWTHRELNPDLQSAELASSRWTMSPRQQSSAGRAGNPPGSGPRGSRTLISGVRSRRPTVGPAAHSLDQEPRMRHG